MTSCIVMCLLLLLLIACMERRATAWRVGTVRAVATRACSARRATSPTVPREWSWAHITRLDCDVFRAHTSARILPGNYASPVVNQHRSGWCGCCYLMAVVQMVQDRWNLKIGQMLPSDGVMHPFVELDAQRILDDYNRLRRKSDRSWNACQGGDPKRVIACLEGGACQLHVSPPKGHVWHGHPRDVPFQKSQSAMRVGEFRVIDNRADAVKRVILSKGPVVLGIDAQCLIHLSPEGVADDSSRNARNHAVSVIGWTTCRKTGKECWITRNSWGADRVPSNLPQDIQCVQTGSNRCAEVTSAWTGTSGFPGYVLVPVKYIERDAAGATDSSPWWDCELIG